VLEATVRDLQVKTASARLSSGFASPKLSGVTGSRQYRPTLAGLQHRANPALARQQPQLGETRTGRIFTQRDHPSDVKTFRDLGGMSSHRGDNSPM
jgi:hypothetical protein